MTAGEPTVQTILEFQKRIAGMSPEDFERAYPHPFLMEWRPRITEFRGELFRIDGKKQEKVPTLTPKATAYSRHFGLIPEHGLRSGNRYRVVYRFKRDGKSESATAEFVAK